MEEKQSVFLRVLKNIPLFDGLETPALQHLAKICVEKSYSRDQMIFAEESQGNSMMIIISGDVRITQIATSQREEALCVLKSGDFFGEMALLENLPRSAAAIANSDAYLLELDQEKFIEFIKSDPLSGSRILFNLAKKLSSRLREADAKIKTFVDLAQWI